MLSSETHRQTLQGAPKEFVHRCYIRQVSFREFDRILLKCLSGKRKGQITDKSPIHSLIVVAFHEI